jgi:hypothetical protein
MFRELEAGQLKDALSAVGELIAGAGERIAIVIVGGAALNLLGIVRRTTSDVDVIARAYKDDAGALKLQPAKPFPPVLDRAIRAVARDFRLDPDWMNSVVDAQWKQGLPPRLIDEITWMNCGGGLDVGLVGRRTLIALKLYAAVDRGAGSVHVQDLIALRPTAGELAEAAEWVIMQDAADMWPAFVAEVVTHVQGIRS